VWYTLYFLDAVGGTSDDWAKNKGIEYVATLEVRDIGQYGNSLIGNFESPVVDGQLSQFQFFRLLASCRSNYSNG